MRPLMVRVLSRREILRALPLLSPNGLFFPFALPHWFRYNPFRSNADVAGHTLV